MFTYVIRCISAVFAFLLTTFAVGLSYIPNPASERLMLPVEVNKATSATTSGVVQVLQSREEIGYKLQQAFDLYTKEEHVNFQFSVQTIGSEADYRSTLRSRLLAGEGPDLFHISGARELDELQDFVRALDSLSWIADAYPLSLDAVMRDGSLYGAPYSLEGAGFVCNSDIFSAAGLSLSEVESFRELQLIFTELSAAISSGELSENYAALEAVCEFPAKDKAFLGGIFADIALSGTFSSPRAAISTPAVTFYASEPVEELIKLIARYSASSGNWPGLTEISYAQQVERFAHEKVAVILADTNVYTAVNELNSKLRGRAFLLPVPIDTLEQASVYIGVPTYWAINAKADETTAQAAEDFLTWLYTSDEGSHYFAEEFAAVSPYQNYRKSTSVALHTQMLRYLAADMVLPSIRRELPQNWGRDALASGIQDYLTDRDAAWEDVIKKCESLWKA